MHTTRRCTKHIQKMMKPSWTPTLRSRRRITANDACKNGGLNCKKSYFHAERLGLALPHEPIGLTQNISISTIYGFMYSGHLELRWCRATVPRSTPLQRYRSSGASLHGPKWSWCILRNPTCYHQKPFCVLKRAPSVEFSTAFGNETEHIYSSEKVRFAANHSEDRN